MKQIIQVTIDKIVDNQHQECKLQAHNQKLQVEHIGLQLPEKGHSTLRLRDGNICQVTHVTEGSDSNVVRLRFRHCDSMVTLSIRDAEQQTADSSQVQPYSEAVALIPANQNDHEYSTSIGHVTQSRF